MIIIFLECIVYCEGIPCFLLMQHMSLVFSQQSNSVGFVVYDLLKKLFTKRLHVIFLLCWQDEGRSPMQQRLPELTMEILTINFHHHQHGFIRSDWIWRPSSMKWRRTTRPTVSSSGHRLGQKQLALLKKERLTVSQSVSDIMEKPCWITIYIYIHMYESGETMFTWKRIINHSHYPLVTDLLQGRRARAPISGTWLILAVFQNNIYHHTPKKLCLMGQLCLRIGFKAIYHIFRQTHINI